VLVSTRALVLQYYNGYITVDTNILVIYIHVHTRMSICVHACAYTRVHACVHARMTLAHARRYQA
jgi:hypothetical protein